MTVAPKTAAWLRSSGLKPGQFLNTNWHRFDRRLATIAASRGWISRYTQMMQNGPAIEVRFIP